MARAEHAKARAEFCAWLRQNDPPTPSEEEDLVSSSEDESVIEETAPEDVEEQAGTATALEGTVSPTPQPSSTAETDITGAVPTQQPSSEDSPPHSPVRFEAITGQPSVETSAAALFAVLSDASASDASASEQHTVTATCTTAGDGNTTPEIGGPERESSFQGTTKASTAVIADAVSFGMTSAQPPSPGKTAVAASPTATDA